jgi:hypothetical protein
MKIVTDTWRQLVQRRLWPVALLLLGALVAVPFVLAKSPEPAPVATAPAPAAGGTKATAASADPIVTLASDEPGATTRRALGGRHNPFAASGPKKKASKQKAATTTQSTDSSKDESTSGGDAPASSGGGGTSAPTPTPEPETETVPAGSIVVRFGSSDSGDLARQTLRKNEALPDEDNPVLVFMGLKENGKTAVFLVSEGLVPTGDGTCTPASVCEQLELEVGETEFFDLEGDSQGTQYQLDLVKVYEHATKVPKTDDSSSDTSSGSS